MIKFVFKVIRFLAVFIFIEGVLLPRALLNDTIPLWINIILISIIFMMILALIDSVSSYLIKSFAIKDQTNDLV